MDAYEAVRLVELDLRRLVRVVLGASWLESARKVGVIEVEKLEEKLGAERGGRPAAVVSTDLLDYTDFTQLRVLILDKYWDAFAPALGKKKHIDAYLSKISGFRNPTMHARDLHPFEKHLVLGISGELRNRIAIYRNTQEAASMYYPIVDSITDNFGNTHDGITNVITQTGVRLEVGDQVTFICRATDPEDRKLHWKFGANGQTEIEATGDEVEFCHTFTRVDVGEAACIRIALRSSGEFHRDSGGDDASAMFHYAVNPPSRHTS